MSLYDLVNNVLKRLDDYPSVGGEPIWTSAEVELYVKDGYDAFCRQTKCILDFFYPENVPLAGNYVGRWERNYFESGMVAVGLINYSGGYWERDYAQASAIGPANLNQPWEAAYVSQTFAVSLHPIPEDNVTVDRAVHEFSELEAEYTRWLEENDRSLSDDDGINRPASVWIGMGCLAFALCLLGTERLLSRMFRERMDSQAEGLPWWCLVLAPGRNQRHPLRRYWVEPPF